MNSTILIKSFFSFFLYSSGLISWRIKQLSTYNFVLLMYHRVLPREKAIGIQAGMYVEPETLELHLKLLKRYFEIIALGKLSRENIHFRSSLNKGGLKIVNLNKEKPFCIITFDDGYYDFYEYAYPLLKTYQAPATIFLPVEFIGTPKWFWTDRLMNLLCQKQSSERIAHNARTKEIKVSELGSATVLKLENLGIIDKFEGLYESNLERSIRTLKSYREERIEEILSKLSRRWEIDGNPSGRAFLTWGEVREMAASGLITFGSHTASHRILTTLTDDEIQDELVRSKERLISEQVVDPSFIPFCYPNGDYNEKIVRMVKEVGYSLAVTTEYGWNSFGADLFTLKRIGIHQDISSTEAMFACRVAGIF